MRIYYPTTGPAGAPELRLDQLEAIYRIKREITEPGYTKSVLVGAGMGSGKTVVSVEVILKTDPRRCLIVGVRDAFGQWAKSYFEQGGTREFLRIDNTPAGQANLASLLAGDEGIFYIGLEMLRAQDWKKVSETYVVPDDKYTAKWGITPGVREQVTIKHLHTYSDMDPVDLLISDEAHKHSNQKSKSIETMETIPAVAKIALSGTFFGNQFINAWSLTTWLWGKPVIGTKGAFEKNFCNVARIMSKSGKPVTTPGGFPLSKVTGEKNPGEFVDTLPCYVFIATPLGPVPRPEIVKVELTKEQQRQYDEMEKQSLTWLRTETGVKTPLVADLPVTQRQRLRTAALGGMTIVPGATSDDPDSIKFLPGAKSATLNAAYDVLHRPSWEGKKALILTHSKQFAIEAARRIGTKYTVALKTGDTKPKVWDDEKARFMMDVSETDSIQYLVAVISAVGTATDGLQYNCAKVLWLSEDDNNVNNIQGGNRVWRDGVDLAEYEAVEIVSKRTISEDVRNKNMTHALSVLASVKGL